MPEKRKSIKEKTVICRHYEDVVGTVGTCRDCGQQRDYSQLEVVVITRGRIKGKLTRIKPPPIARPT